MVLKLGRTSKFSSPRWRGLEVHFSCIRSHIGFTYSDFTVLNLDIEIVNLVSLGSHVLYMCEICENTVRGLFFKKSYSQCEIYENTLLEVY